MNHYNLLFFKIAGQNAPQPFRTSGNKGFTLVELLVVTAILGIVALIATPSYMSYVNRTKNARAIAEIRTLSTEISSYSSDNGGSNPDNLGRINRLNLKDPWNNPYIYNNFFDTTVFSPLKETISNEQYNKDFDLYSKGMDGQSTTPEDNGGDTVDDIIRTNDGVYIGLREH